MKQVFEFTTEEVTQILFRSLTDKGVDLKGRYTVDLWATGSGNEIGKIELKVESKK